ncbi:hypothetical protein RCZ15_07930 [Capnocytophaga catalasegens]|uniref:Uncharacterized protein n=1 Tax=Capnocytophaga catalasegens TaxID=1004260 RepID=A0AAV5AXS7_9FLAO|nr:hypothetical protein RCZ03_18060 [Capnocytophaga catalasegens]GJM49818.1 hypothetical protein RCZ15_07930 [Capnocytophaga catalasegens]GJM52983.1 hypothetical protein RCZ16_13000 [Capnocytophaga catalasegens]
MSIVAKNFGMYFLIVCLLLILLYIGLYPTLWIYDDGIDHSERAKFCMLIFDVVFFSYFFWAKAEFGVFTLILTFLVSAFFITILLTFLNKFAEKKKS